MNIRQIVLDTLQAQGQSAYAAQAEPVINALQTALDGAVDNLVASAVANGMDRSEVVGALTNAGIITEPAETEPEAHSVSGDGNQNLAAVVRDAVAEAVEPLRAFARQHGFRG